MTYPPPEPQYPAGPSSSSMNGMYNMPNAQAALTPPAPTFKPPTVEQALPYTPLTSIVPFCPDVIPFPQAAPTSTSLFANPHESNAAKKRLIAIEAEASANAPGTTTERLERTLQALQSLLESKELTSFTFKDPPLAFRSRLPGSGEAKKAPVSMGKFARRLVNKTKLSFAGSVISNGQQTQQQATPGNPQVQQKVTSSMRVTNGIHNRDPIVKREKAPTPNRATSATSQTPVQQVKQPSVSAHGAPPHGNQQIDPPPLNLPRERSGPMVVIPAKPRQETPITPAVQVVPMPEAPRSPSSPTTAQQTPGGPAVVISTGPSSQRAEYPFFPELDAKVAAGEELGLSKRRNVEDANAIPMSRDQRAMSEAAVRNLNNLFLDIFEADDNCAPGESGVTVTNQLAIFTDVSIDGTNYRTLTPAALEKLSVALSKVISVKQFRLMSVESICRIQKLCQGGILSIPESSVMIADEWSESDVDEWSARLTDVADGLSSAKVLLKTMTAGREDRKLYSEELVQCVLAGLRHILDTLLIVVVESRDSDVSKHIYRVGVAFKNVLMALLASCTTILKQLGQLVATVSITEQARSTIEDLAIRLLFVENATTEKDSVLGIQKFENARRKAMDVVASIFNKYPGQRDSIINSVLASLSSLPVNKQNARQFKTSEGKSIQLVSALFIRLVQSSATYASNSAIQSGGAGNGEDDSESDSEDERPLASKGKTNGAQASAFTLKPLAEPLCTASHRISHYIIGYMIQRANEKSEDSPHEKLLRNFTEDLVNVLDSPEWPGCNSLLTNLALHLINTYENDKTSVSAKNLALDLMGTLHGSVHDLQKHARSMARSLDPGESDLTSALVHLAERVLEDDIGADEIYSFDGPYRVCIEALQRSAGTDLQLQSACGYHLSQWAQMIYSAQDNNNDTQESDRVAVKLKNMITDSGWLHVNYEFPTPSQVQARLATAIIALQTSFSKTMPFILQLIQGAMQSNSALTRSRSINILRTLLDKDVFYFDKSNNVLKTARAVVAKDQSALVRDGALQLLQKCASQDKTTEKQNLALFLHATNDAGVQVRKRALRILKDVYARNDESEIRSSIVSAFLKKLLDLEETVRELAKQMLEEVWIAPYRHADRTVRSAVAMKANVTLITDAIRIDDQTSGKGIIIEAFDTWISGLLSDKVKSTAENFKVFKEIVAIFFDRFIETKEIKDQISILKAAAVFSRADPRLVTRNQLGQLAPYLENLGDTNDLQIFSSAVEIFRQVVPTLSSAQDQLLINVGKHLQNSISKLPRGALNSLALCLEAMSRLVDDLTSKYANMTKSVIMQIQKADKDAKAKLDQPLDEASKAKIIKLINILGAFGNAFDFTPFLATYQKALPSWKGTTISGLFADTIQSRTAKSCDEEIREAAFAAIGRISLRWPKELNKRDILDSMKDVFKEDNRDLQETILSLIKAFFESEEKKSEAGAEIAVGQGAALGAERMGTSLNASDHDGVSTELAKAFLEPIKEIALGSSDDRALDATEVICSISRQGLVHPNDCIPVFVALETSDRSAIAELAFKEHQQVHGKYESIVEKKYIDSVWQAYKYQMEMHHDSRGATMQPFSSKLKSLFYVLRNGSSKVRKGFLNTLCRRIKFDFETVDTSGEGPDSLHFMRYVCENISAFDYVRTDELLVLIDHLDKLLSSTGALVAEAVEREVLPPDVPPTESMNSLVPQPMVIDSSSSNFMPSSAPMMNGDASHTTIQAPKPNINEDRLRHITISSMMLSIVDETRTFLRKHFGLQKIKEGGKKDQLGKAPMRIQFITPEKYSARTTEIIASISSTEAMIAQCRAFKHTFDYDNEHRVASDDEDPDAALIKDAAGYRTPDEDEDDNASEGKSTPGKRGRKRKSDGSGMASGMPTPKKRKGRPPGGTIRKAKKGDRRGSTGSPEKTW